MRIAAVLFALIAAASGPAAADVTLTQTTSGQAAFLDLDGETVARIKGNRMRVDYTRGEQTTTTIIDVDQRRVISLDADAKEARITPLADLRDRVNEAGIGEPRALLTPTSKKRKVAGQSCVVHDVSASFPFTPGNQGVQMTVLLSGPACLSKRAPGYAEYASFFRRAAEKGFVIGDPESAKAGGIASLYRAMADGGLLLDQDLAIHFQGAEPMASLMNQMGQTRFANTVTKIETADLPDALFDVPDDFAVQN